jgi:hypothetical protein
MFEFESNAAKQQSTTTCNLAEEFDKLFESISARRINNEGTTEKLEASRVTTIVQETTSTEAIANNETNDIVKLDSDSFFREINSFSQPIGIAEIQSTVSVELPKIVAEPIEIFDDNVSCRYTDALEAFYNKIIGRQGEKLDTIKKNINELTVELNEYATAVPQFKSEIDSLRERLYNIMGYANRASEQRYLQDAQSEVILAHLIMQILDETADIDELKPLVSDLESGLLNGDDFFDILANNKELKLDEALSGFDFFDNNPFRQSAERRLAKIERKKNKWSK